VSKQKKDSSKFYRVCYAIFARFVGFFMRIHVICADKEPKEGNFLVCSNHIGATDPIILSYAFHYHQVHFMAKKELFKVPVLGSLIRMFGAFPVDRSVSDVGAIRHAIALLEDGKCMGIFPQGHRYPGEDPRGTKTKNGAAMVCMKSGADVMPVYIWRKNRTPKLFRKTYVIFGDLIPHEDLAALCQGNGDYARISERIFDDICILGEKFELERKKS